jgi:hypothetical protein
MVLNLDLSCAFALTADVSQRNVFPSTTLQLASNEDSKTSSNTLFYQDDIRSALNQYRDDLNYSSRILDAYVKKNISDQDAFTSTVSIFTLVSQNLEDVEQIKPPKDYLNQYNNSMSAVFNLKWYTWNLAKFYETKNIIYAANARDYFNKSLKYDNEATRELRSTTLP